MKRYIKLKYTELREKCLNSELEHRYTAEQDYELLLDYECLRDEPDSIVMDFCRIGLTKLGKYSKYKWLFEKAVRENTEKTVPIPVEPPEKSYSELRYDELRVLLLDGKLHPDYMSESDYERLFTAELDSGIQDGYENNAAVVGFCIAGLKKFENYKDLTDEEIYFGGLSRQVAIRKAECEVMETFHRPKLKFSISLPITVIRFTFKHPKLSFAMLRELFNIFYRKHKPIAVSLIVVLSFSAVTLTASAFGYNLFDMVRRAVNAPDEDIIDDEGREAIHTYDTRIYNSMREMIEAESLNILYPAYLPIGYKFTDFGVTDFDVLLEILVRALEPYIRFRVEVGANFQIEDYDYEVNGIRYSVIELDSGLYQAFFNVGLDYYEIVATDRDILSEIIENLQES